MRWFGIQILTSQAIYQSFMNFHGTSRFNTRGFNLPPNSFSKVFLDAVEESLSLLGDSPKQAIFYHLESSFKLKREHIPGNLTEFAKALEGIFGPGAAFLEKLITQRLYEKLGLSFQDEGNGDFLEWMNNARKSLVS